MHQRAKTQIITAELFAILISLRWASGQTKQFNGRIDFHIVTDSKYAISILCRNRIQKKNFYIIQEIVHYALCLSPYFNISLHWIPSHIDEKSGGKLNIYGNIAADKLAKRGREISEDHANHQWVKESNIDLIRDSILNLSAELVSGISSLLEHSLPTSDGPSSDDFRSANANQIILYENDL
jgi:ribonuclease HI